MKRVTLKKKKRRVIGPGKGGGFERLVCKILSRWVTNGKRIDVFGRTAMSGGLATIKGDLIRQAGDIMAIAPEGFPLADYFFFECKHRKNIRLDIFLLRNTSALAHFWRKTCQEAKRHRKVPIMICRPNGLPIFVVTRPGALNKFTAKPLRALIDVYDPGDPLVDYQVQLLDTVVKYRFRAP